LATNEKPAQLVLIRGVPGQTENQQKERGVQVRLEPMPVTAHKQALIRSLMYQNGQHNRKQTSNQYQCWYQLKASTNNLKQKQVRGNLTSLVPTGTSIPRCSLSTRPSTEIKNNPA
jgi:hypothetical protein